MPSSRGYSSPVYGYVCTWRGGAGAKIFSPHCGFSTSDNPDHNGPLTVLGGVMAITTGVSYQFYSGVTRGPLLQRWKKGRNCSESQPSGVWGEGSARNVYHIPKIWCLRWGCVAIMMDHVP